MIDAARLAEPVVLLDAMASDPGDDVPLAQRLPTAREVVSLIRVKRVEGALRTAIESRCTWDRNGRPYGCTQAE
uniref:Uncharacterized protein n=1 Tax=Ralstonia solanacearum TaxID=305 RepID=A0A0S4WGQ3_RALSL|nr:conserved protein of unknown function [Ralstonia solanacearum]